MSQISNLEILYSGQIVLSFSCKFCKIQNTEKGFKSILAFYPISNIGCVKAVLSTHITWGNSRKLITSKIELFAYLLSGQCIWDMYPRYRTVNYSSMIKVQQWESNAITDLCKAWSNTVESACSRHTLGTNWIANLISRYIFMGKLVLIHGDGNNLNFQQPKMSLTNMKRTWNFVWMEVLSFKYFKGVFIHALQKLLFRAIPSGKTKENSFSEIIKKGFFYRYSKTSAQSSTNQVQPRLYHSMELSGLISVLVFFVGKLCTWPTILKTNWAAFCEVRLCIFHVLHRLMRSTRLLHHLFKRMWGCGTMHDEAMEPPRTDTDCKMQGLP